MLRVCLLGIVMTAWAGDPVEEGLRRAVPYLSREVPAWRAGNGCFSCHNNGDAARALLVARKAGWAVPPTALGETLEWLGKPGEWDSQQSDAPYRDKNLARIQFAHALVEAIESGAAGKPALAGAAGLIVELQAPDGSWKLEQEGGAGSPATYGTALGTYAALRVLRSADPTRFAAAIRKAERYLASLQSAAVLDRAAVMMALGDPDGSRRAALLTMQTGDGGWGPYKETPAEVFDTAIAILALVPQCGAGNCRQAVARGVKWILAAQADDGGWPATTRPSGAGSYAQHISTTGWATLALLRTRP